MADYKCSLDGRPAHRPAKTGEGHWCEACYQWSRRHEWADPSARKRKRSHNPGAVCDIEGCSGPHQALGLCRYHYQQQLRRGKARDPFRKKPHTPGERHWNARLTDDAVRAARAAWVKGSQYPDPGSTRSLAIRYGVQQNTMKRVLTGQRWTHVK